MSRVTRVRSFPQEHFISNSRLANEGYLGSLEIEPDPTFSDELARLNSAFGIGVITLYPLAQVQSEIIFPSRINPEIDWNTANRLATENPEF